VIGLARALPYDVVHAQGGSTITEQVAKPLYLNGNDHSPWWKLEDMALAIKEPLSPPQRERLRRRRSAQPDSGRAEFRGR